MNKKGQSSIESLGRFRILEDEGIIPEGFIAKGVQVANEKARGEGEIYLEFVRSYLTVKFHQARAKEVIESSNARSSALLERHQSLTNQESGMNMVTQAKLTEELERERQRLIILKRIYQYIDKIPSK